MGHTDKSTYGSTADEWQYTRRDYNTSEGKRDQWHAPGIATVDVADDGTFAIWARDEPGGELVLVQIPAAVARAMAERRLDLDLETINEARATATRSARSRQMSRQCQQSSDGSRTDAL